MTDEKKDPWADLLGKAGKLAQEFATEVQKNAKILGENVREAAEKTSEKAKQMSLTAKKLVGVLNSAAVECQNRDAFVKSITETLPEVAAQFDSQANALGIGFLAEAGAGLAGATGIEVLYVRKSDGERAVLKVSRTEGKSVRAAIGASSNAYAVSLYGEPVVLKSATKRRGADVDVLVASIGFFSITSAMAAPDQRSGGWFAGLGAGLNIGIPILSDLTAFEIEEQIIEKITLTDEEVEALEKAVETAPDRSTRRKIAKAL
jgi:hypothetical protein